MKTIHSCNVNKVLAPTMQDNMQQCTA